MIAEKLKKNKISIIAVIAVIGFARCLLGDQRGGLDVQKGCRNQQKVARHV